MTVLEKKRVGARIHIWRTERGSLGIEQPRPHVLIFQPAGHLDADLVQLFIEVVDAAIAMGRPHLFWDGEDMDGYDTAFRHRIGQYCLSVKAKVGSMNVYTPSPMVAMGAAVINIALGGFFNMVKKKADLEALIARVTMGDVDTTDP